VNTAAAAGAAEPVPALAAHTDRAELRDPVFISDLHLNDAQPRTLAAFLQFARTLAITHRELVILGDLFEFWVGDDADDPIGATVAVALRDVVAAGTAVYLMHGNRDLLLGRGFCAASGATLLADPTVAQRGAEKFLLAHGDAWCTRDLAYMAFRKQVRDASFQRQFLARSVAERRAFIGQVRATSEAGKQVKAMAIMDVTPAEVDAALLAAGVQRVIHGHTHRPATHRFVLDGKDAERWVLPDWDLDHAPARGGYLTLRDGWRVQAIASA